MKRTHGSRRPQGRPHSPKLDTAREQGLKQKAMSLTPQKPTQRDRLGEVPEACDADEHCPASTLERGRREEKRRELGRSFNGSDRKRAARHTDIETHRGKPGNESRPEPKRTREGHGSGRQVGELDPKRRGAEGLEEVRCADSTGRTGEPFTGERGGQKGAAHKGKLARRRKAGQTRPTSL